MITAPDDAPPETGCGTDAELHGHGRQHALRHAGYSQCVAAGDKTHFNYSGGVLAADYAAAEAECGITWRRAAAAAARSSREDGAGAQWSTAARARSRAARGKSAIARGQPRCGRWPAPW